MIKETTKLYTPPTVDVVELTADNAIMQMSSNGIPELGETVTNPGNAIWS